MCRSQDNCHHRSRTCHITLDIGQRVFAFHAVAAGITGNAFAHQTEYGGILCTAVTHYDETRPVGSTAPYGHQAIHAQRIQLLGHKHLHVDSVRFTLLGRKCRQSFGVNIVGGPLHQRTHGIDCPGDIQGFLKSGLHIGFLGKFLLGRKPYVKLFFLGAFLVIAAKGVSRQANSLCGCRDKFRRFFRFEFRQHYLHVTFGIFFCFVPRLRKANTHGLRCAFLAFAAADIDAVRNLFAKGRHQKHFLFLSAKYGVFALFGRILPHNFQSRGGCFSQFDLHFMLLAAALFHPQIRSGGKVHSACFKISINGLKHGAGSRSG